MTKKNKLVFLLMLVLGIAIFLFSVRNVSFSALVVDIQHLHWGWLIVAFCSMFFSFFLEAIVVKALLHKETMTLRWRDALRIPLIEQLFNGITPFSSGGQPAQLFAMLQSGADAGRATSVLLMKFVVYQSMIVVNFIFALLTGFHFVADKMQVLSLLFVLGFVVHLCVIMALLMIMYWYSFTKRLVKAFFKPLRWLSKSNRYEKLEEKVDVKIDNFYEESLRLKRDGWLLFKISCLTLVQLFFYYIIPYFILLGLGVSGVNFWMITTMHILIVMVISLFPIPGGSGGAEYSFSTIFSSFITNSSKLILAMILWRIITYYFGMFLGMIALVIPPQKMKKIDK